jgi:hypothetical protein
MCNNDLRYAGKVLKGMIVGISPSRAPAAERARDALPLAAIRCEP